MPITGNTSYIPTANIFLAHWTAANAALAPGGAVVLPAGETLDTLVETRDLLSARFVEVISAVNDVELARADLAFTRARGREVVAAFIAAVRGRLADSRFVPALPPTPGERDSAQGIAKAAEDAAFLWARINELPASPALPGPLVLSVPPPRDPLGEPVELTRADFLALLEALRGAATALSHAELALTMARHGRDGVKKRLYEMLKAYRQAVPAFFTEGSAVRQALPALTPAPGSTPEPVTASGAWDAESGRGRVAFTASGNPHLRHYELRRCPGAVYHTDDEVHVASLPGGADPREFLTLAGLAQPGAVALYRVYVVLTTGNERGSNTVAVTRPG